MAVRGVCWLALALILNAPVALAQTRERAAELDRQARRAFAEGDFRAAAQSFDQADRLAPYPELRYNAALSWERAGEPARAADGYESALERGGLDAEREQRARENLAALKRRLGYVRVLGPAGGTLSAAHLERAPLPIGVHLSPGEHVLVIEQPNGATRRETIAVRAGQVLTIEPKPEPTPLPPSPPPPPEPADRRPAEVSGSSHTTWAIAMFAGAAAFGGAAVYFGLETESTRDDYERSGFSDAELRDRGLTYRALTNVAIGASIACAGVGVYLVLDRPSQASVGVGLGAGSATARLRF